MSFSSIKDIMERVFENKKLDRHSDDCLDHILNIIQEFVYDVSIKDFKAGILILETESSAALNELTIHKSKILDLINNKTVGTGDADGGIKDIKILLKGR